VIFFFYFLSLIHPSTSGNIDLHHNFPLLGNSQLRVTSVMASLLLLAGHLFLAGLVKGRVLVQDSSVHVSPIPSFIFQDISLRSWTM
jgi:hypothetical protein